MNRIVKLLIISDLLILSSFGLISPIFALFVKEELVGGSIVAAGTASALFLVTKGLLTIPFGKLADRYGYKGLLILGSILFSLCPFLYYFATDVIHIYMIQVLYGMGEAMAFPTYMALFTLYSDNKEEGYEWGVYDTVVSLSMAGAAFLGAELATILGYRTVFLVVGVVSIIGSLLLFLVKVPEKVKKKKRRHKRKVTKHRSRHH